MHPGPDTDNAPDERDTEISHPSRTQPLREALLYSIPGAALLSIPFGHVLQRKVLESLGISLPVDLTYLGELPLVGALSLITAVSSLRATLVCTERTPRSSFRTVLLSFNIIALIAAFPPGCFAIAAFTALN